jgi:hypothetical protein
LTELDRYLEAATRQNTQRSYASALRHFEVEWGGHLPATPHSVARYLAEQAPRAAINTLRLAALAHWHAEHGFVDPTRSFNAAIQATRSLKSGAFSEHDWALFEVGVMGRASMDWRPS